MKNKISNKILKSIVLSSEKEFYEKGVVLNYSDNEFTFSFNSESPEWREIYNSATSEDYFISEKQLELIQELANDIFKEKKKEDSEIIEYNEQGY